MMYLVKIWILWVFYEKTLIKTTKTCCFYQIVFVVFYQPIRLVGLNISDGNNFFRENSTRLSKFHLWRSI